MEICLAFAYTMWNSISQNCLGFLNRRTAQAKILHQVNIHNMNEQKNGNYRNLTLFGSRLAESFVHAPSNARGS